MWGKHPTTGKPGIWVERSGDAKGTITGLAETAFPSVGAATLGQYQTTLTSTAQTVLGPSAALVITITSLQPLIYSFEVDG